MSILDTLVDKGAINRYQVDEILQESRGDDREILRLLNILGIDEESLLGARAQELDLPFRSINSQNVSTDGLEYIPEPIAQQYRLIPLGFTSGGELEVGMVDPANIEARNALQFVANKKNISYVVTLISDEGFQRAMTLYGNLSSEASTALEGQDSEMSGLMNVADEVSRSKEADMARMNKDQTPDEKGRIVEDAPVAKMLAVILRHAVEGNASDIHIEHSGENVKVRFRVDGVLHTSLILNSNVHSALVARVKILTKLKLDEKRKPQDGRFYAVIDDTKVDFRVSTLPTYHGEKVVIRILDQSKGVKMLDQTGMKPDHVKMVRRALARPYGLVLITGPTGSGKSTTLYSMVQELDRERYNVISLEDPIEYNIGGMSQSQVHPEIGYTFANGLRSILRQDPDIIMVGEIRDKETAQLAIQAALTGHLVFSTLHTNNSIGVIPRLIDMGVDPYLIAPTLTLAIAQRLSRRLCNGAGVKQELDPGLRQLITQQFNDFPEQFKGQLPLKDYVYQAQKTEECPSGIRGRLAIYEMYEVDTLMQEVILSKPSEQDIYQLARTRGMITMKEDAILKSMEGLIPFSEVAYFG